MTTNTPNFNLVLAATSDTVDVTAHIANNLSSLDSIIGAAHTGTGELKRNLVITSPILQTPTISGAVTVDSIVANTGRFNIVFVSGGTANFNVLAIGTYSLPAAAGNPGDVLTVVTGNAVFIAPSAGSAANTNLSNLTAVAINTNLNTFTAGYVTLDTLKSNSVTGTGGILTGMTQLSATTGTFGNLVVSGTVNAAAINVTGGSITAGSLAVGTYSLPSTIGTTGALLTVTSGPALAFNALNLNLGTAFSLTNIVQITASTATSIFPSFTTELYDLGNNVTTGIFTAPSSGVYEFSFGFVTTAQAASGDNYTVNFGLRIATTQYAFGVATGESLTNNFRSGVVVATVAQGAAVSLYISGSGSTTTAVSRAAFTTASNVPVSYFAGKKVPTL